MHTVSYALTNTQRRWETTHGRYRYRPNGVNLKKKKRKAKHTPVLTRIPGLARPTYSEENCVDLRPEWMGWDGMTKTITLNIVVPKRKA